MKVGQTAPEFKDDEIEKLYPQSPGNEAVKQDENAQTDEAASFSTLFLKQQQESRDVRSPALNNLSQLKSRLGKTSLLSHVMSSSSSHRHKASSARSSAEGQPTGKSATTQTKFPPIQVQPAAANERSDYLGHPIKAKFQNSSKLPNNGAQRLAEENRAPSKSRVSELRSNRGRSEE